MFLKRMSHHSFFTKNRRAMTMKTNPMQMKMTTTIPESRATCETREGGASLLRPGDHFVLSFKRRSIHTKVRNHGEGPY